MCVYMLLEQEGLSEKVEVSNLGVAKKGPVIVTEHHLILEYTNGSVCEADGVMTTYTTRIHFFCPSGTAVSHYWPFAHLYCYKSVAWTIREQYYLFIFIFFCRYLVLAFLWIKIAPWSLFGTQKQPAPSQPLRTPIRSTLILAQNHWLWQNWEDLFSYFSCYLFTDMLGERSQHWLWV